MSLFFNRQQMGGLMTSEGCKLAQRSGATKKISPEVRSGTVTRRQYSRPGGPSMSGYLSHRDLDLTIMSLLGFSTAQQRTYCTYYEDGDSICAARHD